MVNPQVSTYFEIDGKLRKHAASELFSEIASAGLSGSLRLENGQQKAVVYFSDGKLVYAASNARQHRLFDLLMRTGQATQEQITACKDFTNDHALSAQLIGKNILNKEALGYIFREQLREIVDLVIKWNDGDWQFNALARIKEEVWQEFDLNSLLREMSANISAEEVSSRINYKQETFTIVERTTEQQQVLTSPEYFVLSRLDHPLSIYNLSILTGFPEDETAKLIYKLWMSGFVSRENGLAAFSSEKVADLLSAEIQIKEKPKFVAPAPVAEKAAPEAKEAEAVPEAPEEITIEKYLEQVEKAETYYDVLGVFQNAQLADIKANYFSFAKKFHPDKYHLEAGSKFHQRLQHAFTQISQSYDTLKDPESREVYNFKMRRELERLKKRQELLQEMEAQGQSIDAANEAEIKKLEHASEEFEYGFEYLMNEEYADAVPHLARAVSLAPKQARYHAYYGKALSFLDKNRHQAEKELVTAIKIEPGNTAYRLLLIEFYIDVNMPKRAEGELKKLLVKEPRNEEAKRLLESLQYDQ